MESMQYTLIRSKRKTVAIRILPNGGVEVRAPLRTPKAYLDRLILEKADWIAKTSAAQAAKAQLYPLHRFIEGERFLLLGDSLFLTFSDAVKKPVAEEDRLLVPHAEPERVKAMLKAWYRAKARAVFQERLAFYAFRCGVTYQGFKLSSAESRWGSCSGNGNINLTWRLIMASVDIIDYVVVHELCHIKQPNHQQAFWSCVKEVLPDYQEKRAWLKAHARELQF